MGSEILGKQPQNRDTINPKKTNGAKEYLGAKFGEKTNTKIKEVLQHGIWPKEYSSPLRAANHNRIFGELDFIEPEDRQKMLRTTERQIEDILTDDLMPTTVTATRWASAHLELGGKKCWTNKDNVRMKKDLGDVVSSFITDEDYFMAADYAATYKSLFGDKIWTDDQNVQMIQASEKELRKYIEKNPEEISLLNIGVISDRAATIMVLSATDAQI